MSSAGTFRVERVDDAILEGFDGVFDESGFVERVGVDGDLDVHFVGDREADVDCAGSGAPVFVKFKAHGSGDDLFAEGFRIGGIAFAHEAEVHGVFFGGFEHAADIPGAGGASGGVGAGCWTGAAACHRGDAASEGFVDLLGADEVNVGVESSCGDDVAFAGDYLGGGADDHVGIDAVLDTGVAAVADADYTAGFDADIRFDDALLGVEDSGVGDYEVERVLVGSEWRLAHAVAYYLAAAEFDFVAVSAVFSNEVAFYFYKEISVAETDLVADGGSEHFGVLFSIEFEAHF